MAGKKKTRNLKGFPKVDLKALKACDVLCPICRSILIEPVSLPCNHVFCKACFQDTMENANLVCPLCRTRVGSWYRKVKKENRVVDESFWSAIKDSFPQEVQNKYDGLDSLDEDKPVIVVADPGEIRKEYEIERKREEQEMQRLRRAEEEASTALIQKIREEEEYQQVVEEENLKYHALLAQKWAKELSPSTSKQKKIFKMPKGPMDKFICNSNRKHTSVNNGTAIYKNDFLNSSDEDVILVASKQIKNKYEVERKKEKQEKQRLCRTEEDPSTALIQKIREEEECRQVVGEEKPKYHARLAKKLAKEMSPSTSKQKKTLKMPDRPMDKFICTQSKKSIRKQTNFTPKEQSSGVLCLDKFPKSKKNGATNPVMPVVQKKIQQIHKILEKEEQVNKSKSKGNASALLDSKYYFKPIEIVRQSPDDLRNYEKPTKILSIRPTVKEELQILPPAGNRLLVLEHKGSSFAKFIFCEKQDLVAPKTTENRNDQTSLTSSPKRKESQARRIWQRTNMSKYEKSTRSKNNNNVNFSSPQRKTRRHTQRKYSSSSSGGESPFLGFEQRKPGHSTTKPIELNDTDTVPDIGKVNPNQSYTTTLLGFDEDEIEMSTHLSTKVNALNGTSKKSSAALNNSLHAFLGFNINKDATNTSLEEDEINIAEDMNTSMAESFHGFDKSEKSNHFFTNISPEIPSTSYIKLTNQNRPKRGGVTINGLTQTKNERETLQDEKERNIETSENKRKRKLQEDSDFQLAKKLQAELNQHLIPKRTRNGTIRQATLNELSTFW